MSPWCGTKEKSWNTLVNFQCKIFQSTIARKLFGNLMKYIEISLVDTDLHTWSKFAQHLKPCLLPFFRCQCEGLLFMARWWLLTPPERWVTSILSSTSPIRRSRHLEYLEMFRLFRRCVARTKCMIKIHYGKETQQWEMDCSKNSIVVYGFSRLFAVIW